MQVTLRDRGASAPRQASPARSRARRISLGALAALLAAPAPSLADTSSRRTRSPAKPAATPTTTTYDFRLATGGVSRQLHRLQEAFAAFARRMHARHHTKAPAPTHRGALNARRTRTASARHVEHPRHAPHGERYVYPLPGGFTAGRTDMGVDFSAPTGKPILAIGAAKITGIYSNWYPPGGPNGGNLLEYKLLGGPSAGRRVYVAEQIALTVHVGERVRAGAVLGRYAASGTGIETGWAAGAGATLAQASTGYHEGEETRAGRSFRSFLRSLSASQARRRHSVRAHHRPSRG